MKHESQSSQHTIGRKMILEVPEQTGQILPAVLDYATEKRILIRDHNGTPYNTLPPE